MANNDSTFVKGFRTQMAYYPESTFGTFSVTSTKCQRVGGKLKGVNWTARQNITQTGSVGQGRNFTQQLLGQYDANASLNFEVIDLSFLRFGVGDIAIWNGNGITDAAPFFLVESELTGVDNDTTTSQTLLAGTDTIAYTKVRIRPFSMLLYDQEMGASSYNDNVDQLMGCMINDFSLSSNIGSPLMCNVNMVVREIAYRRYLSDVPDFSGQVSYTDDYGNGFSSMTPDQSAGIAAQSPLMFYHGTVSVYDDTALSYKKLGQVQSFNYNWSNNLLTYRQLGSRFINLPQTGMRRQGLTINVIFRIPEASNGVPGTDTSILEFIKNYLGYTSAFNFTTATLLRPALSTDSVATSQQITKPIEKTSIKLSFIGVDNSGNERGANIYVRNAAVEGFGLPVTLENGLIEIPITFSVRGQQYNRVSDGSYGGHSDGSTAALAGYNRTFEWWQTA
jgi:hypothetical protein